MQRGHHPVSHRHPHGNARAVKTAALLLASLALFLSAPTARSEAPVELERRALGALSWLYARSHHAASLSQRSVAVLVFPDAKKVGIGAAITTGTGVLFRGLRPAAYLNLSGLSLGLEAGIQEFSHAIFFTSEEALDSFYLAGGLETGATAGLVLIDGLLGADLSTNSRGGIIPFTFRRSGLMLTLALQASKYTEYSPGG